MDGPANAISQTETVRVLLHNRYADGFTSDGVESAEAATMFALEHLTGFGSDTCENYALNQLPDLVSGVAGYTMIGVHAIEDGVVDYYNGRAEAALLDNVADSLMQTEIYDNFDCNAVNVHYNAVDIPSECVYAESGRYTNSRIDYYNETFPEYHVSLNDIINKPSAVCNDMIELVEQGYSFEELSSVRGGE